MLILVLAGKESKICDANSFMGFWRHLWAGILAIVAPTNFGAVSVYFFGPNPNWYHLFLVGFSSLCCGLCFGLVMVAVNWK